MYKKSSDYAKEPSKPIFNKSHDILSIFNLYPYHVLLETYKVLKFRLPYCIYELFSNYSITRNQHGLTMNVPKSSLLIERTTFSYQGIISWNLVYKSLLTPVSLDLHPSCRVKGDQSTITAIIWDYTTNIPTFKLRLKKLLLNTQHPTDSPDAWSKIDTLLHTA